MIEQQMEREAKNGKEAITICEMLTKYWDGGVAEGIEQGIERGMERGLAGKVNDSIKNADIHYKQYFLS